MSVGRNAVQLLGNAVEDPKHKDIKGDKSLSEFRFAVNNPRNKNATPLFIKVAAWSGLGKVAQQLIKKGGSALLEGRLHVNQYTDKDGSLRQSPELVLDNITALGAGSGASDNAVVLIGNLVKDPTFAYTKGTGTPIVRFRLAVNGIRKTDKTEFIDVVGFKKLAEISNTYLKKGKQVFVRGSLAARTYVKPDGKKGDSVEVIMSEMRMLGSKNGHAEGLPNTESQLEDIPF